MDKIKNYTLTQNNITYIKYDKNNYQHNYDRNNIFKSDDIIECTMILCLNSNCDGGHTVIHFNGNFKYLSNASITNGNVIILKKDMMYENEIIKSGSKEVLIANILCTNISSHKIVIVSFPDDDRKYVINHSDILAMENCVINLYIDFHIKNGKIKEENNVYEYISEIVDYNKFNIIYRILTNKYFSIEERVRKR